VVHTTNNAKALFLLGLIGLVIFFPIGVVLLFMAASAYQPVDMRMARISKIIAWAGIGLVVVLPAVGLLLMMIIGFARAGG
jgi:hypothetical protein